MTENKKRKFAVCLNCMDGRVQIPVIRWIKKNYSVDYVDIITEPGMDGILSDEKNDINSILLKIETSIDKHNSCILFVVGHFDCAGNPVNDKSHKKHICIAVNRLKNLKSFVRIIGLWVSNEWMVEKIIEQ
ncbi:MAG: hypothetical protein M1135_04200 [Candidatus Omnitrophica bacterium]|jgi:carbonic anhydrase|nr:hypothetical protein [Candidatus Omnitrophota bacterium]